MTTRRLDTPDGKYTHDQVDEVLRAVDLVVTWKFEILTPALDVVDEIPTNIIQRLTNDDGERLDAFDVDVDVSADRTEFGNLGLDMLAYEPLRYRHWQRRIKAWLGLLMRDGGYAWFPMGVYVWRKPTRSVRQEVEGFVRRRNEIWSVSLLDKMFILEASGPNRQIFDIDRDGLLTDGLVELALRVGETDLSGIVPSTQRTTKRLSWIHRSTQKKKPDQTFAEGHDKRVKKRHKAFSPTSWLGIATKICSDLGYDPPHYDWNGRLICRPATDLNAAEIEVTYGTATDSITVEPIEIDIDEDDIVNLLLVEPRRTDIRAVWVDLNDLVPGHPLSEQETGFYVDDTMTSVAGSDRQIIRAKGERELLERATAFERESFETRVYPAHGILDIYGVYVAGDAELNELAVLQGRSWSIDGTARMRHEVRRIIGVNG